MEKRITKTMKNEDIIAILRGEPTRHNIPVSELIAHIEHENELLSKKNTSTKPSKASEKSELLRDKILNYLMTQTEGVTATQIADACELSSNQQAAKLLVPFIESKRILKDKVKGRSVFYINPERV